MESLILKIKDIAELKGIGVLLEKGKPLAPKQTEILANFIQQLPNIHSGKSNNDIPMYQDSLKIEWSSDFSEETEIEKWLQLFSFVPGGAAEGADLVMNSNLNYLKKGIIILITFSPTMEDSFAEHYFELHLKQDRTAQFWMPSVDDARNYLELFNFNGTWEDSYFLLKTILKKGWPLDESPPELVSLLQK